MQVVRFAKAHDLHTKINLKFKGANIWTLTYTPGDTAQRAEL